MGNCSAIQLREFSLTPHPNWITENNPLARLASSIADTILPRNPVTKKREFHLIPERIEIGLGKSIYSSLINSQGGAGGTAAERALVKKVGNKLSAVSDRPHLPFEFTVIDSSSLNAWCLLGGKTGFNQGLLDALDNDNNSYGVGSFTLEEKVAAVMGHEITHATARHSAKGLEFALFLSAVLRVAQIALCCFASERRPEEGKRDPVKTLARTISVVFKRCYNLIYTLVISSNSRSAELEADKYGMVYLKRAGYDPKVAIWLQKFLGTKEKKIDVPWIKSGIALFSSHPTSETRVRENERTLAEINAGKLA